MTDALANDAHCNPDISAKRARLWRSQVRSEKARANRRLGGWNCFAARPAVLETNFMFLITVAHTWATIHALCVNGKITIATILW